MIPIRVRLVGDDADNGYIIVTDYASSNDPIPHIEVSIELDLEKIAEDIGRIRKEKKERETICIKTSREVTKEVFERSCLCGL